MPSKLFIFFLHGFSSFVEKLVIISKMNRTKISKTIKENNVGNLRLDTKIQHSNSRPEELLSTMTNFY